MGSYAGLTKFGMMPIRFIRDSSDEHDLVELIEREIQESRSVVLFIDAMQWRFSRREIISNSATELTGGHAPYDDNWWLQFVDDLSCAAEVYSGLIVFVSDAHSLLDNDKEFFFSIIEAFFAQYKSWARLQKSSVICLQMKSDVVFRTLFKRLADRKIAL
jgi:hypothetical protein